MKYPTYLLLGMVLLILALSACGTPSGGPQVWLDWPLDNANMPLAPLTIQAHASDEDGVARFEFYANDTPLFTVESDGARLGEAITEWLPLGPGTYTIRVHAIDSGGNVGADATSVVTIGDEMGVLTTTAPVMSTPLCTLPQLVAPQMLDPADNIEVTSPVHFTWAYPNTDCHPHSWRIDISELSDFGDTSWGFSTLDYLETNRDWPLPAGSCYSWRVLAYVPDDYGPPSATRRFCIQVTPTTTYTPIASLTATNTPTLPLIPSVTPSPTVEIIVDITPPSFYSIGVSPNLMLTEGSGCENYERTLTVAAAVAHDSDLSSVVAYWNIGGTESGQVPLQEGGLGHWATIGPVNTVGILDIYMIAVDTSGNSAQSDTLYVTVNNCIE